MIQLSFRLHLIVRNLIYENGYWEVDRKLQVEGNKTNFPHIIVLTIYGQVTLTFCYAKYLENGPH